jgi:uncharacterized RDD family membrane protein YckC
MDTQQAVAPAINPYAPPRAAVRDVFDASAAAEPAERGTRLGAMILDSIIFGVMVYAPIFIIAVAGGASGADGEAAGTMMTVGFIVALIGFVAWSWLTIRYVQQNGQTIGKKLLGIKVVRSDGSPISLGRIFWLRNVVNTLISVFPFYALVDILFIFGESRQCLHDKLADTIVVKA